MTKLFAVILLFGFYSCGQDKGKHKINPQVATLANKIIPLVRFLNNPDSCRKALLFLDSATALDDKCFPCFQNKIMFLYMLKQYDKALLTNDTLLKMAPNAFDLYLSGGLLRENNQDTISSKVFFKKSLAICNSVLDTMSTNNNNYYMFVTNKAVNLIMLDSQNMATETLKNYCKNLPNDCEATKPFMNMNKKEILHMFTSPQDSL